MTNVSTIELFNACDILFGPEVEVSLQFLEYLRPSGLKTAFRQRALETHPDRAKSVGEYEGKMAERFREVVQAYEKLKTIIRDDGKIVFTEKPSFQRKKKKTPPQKSWDKGVREHFYVGNIPRRELLIGQFLYYSGLISWQAFIKAITWQRRKRLPLGQIALEWEMLSSAEILDILEGRSFNEKFGEYAVRKGYLSRFELLAVLGKQRRLSRPFGEYFIKKRIFSPESMDRMVAMQRIHNQKVAFET